MHSKLTPIERLAVRVSVNIEDGDVKGAVRLAASDNMIASCHVLSGEDRRAGQQSPTVYSNKRK